MNEEKIKLVVWDLDNTLWQGVLTEDEKVILDPCVETIIKTLDERGILQSIASKNAFPAAMQQLKALCLDTYFIYPEINWNAKSENIQKIVKQINISENTVAFIDDQAFEREEVQFRLPAVRCIDARELDSLLDREDMNPEFVTSDSKIRRVMYQNDIKRDHVEKEFEGTPEEFLRTLDLQMQVTKAKKEDLQRAAELTVRTHQLNSTGYTYSYDELCLFVDDASYGLYVVDLTDKYGYYGKIGLLLLHYTEQRCIIKLLLTSCRVMSRGIGGVLLRMVINHANDKKIPLYAEFLPTDRNRIMEITYSLTGFVKAEEAGDVWLMKHTNTKKYDLPDYISICSEM